MVLKRVVKLFIQQEWLEFFFQVATQSRIGGPHFLQDPRSFIYDRNEILEIMASQVIPTPASKEGFQLGCQKVGGRYKADLQSIGEFGEVGCPNGIRIPPVAES